MAFRSTGLFALESYACGVHTAGFPIVINGGFA